MNNAQNNSPRLPDCIDGSSYTPDACERETVRGMNRNAPKCAAGHGMTFSMAVGGYRCEFGALHRANGAEVRECPSKRADDAERDFDYDPSRA